MKKYLELDAFELGLLCALMAGSDPNNLPQSFRDKVKKAADQVYLNSGFSEKEVFGKKGGK